MQVRGKEKVVCSKCGELKELKDYPYRKETNKYRPYCKECKNKEGREWYKKGCNAEKTKAQVRKYKRDNKDKLRCSRHNIETDILYNMLDKQQYTCKICGIKGTIKTLFIDHNHSTGKVRGLLCHYCNTGLGFFKDSTSSLKSAIKYLKANYGN